MQMMSGNAFSIPSSFGGFPPQVQVQEQTTNPTAKPNPNPAAKKKRNLPGTPDPDAEVIALSPKTLMATNRFICEICNKGFQRDQNLQLHRRGHNLPWKLRQRTNKEVKKKVYICPEKTCIHHDPSRALGDLTGIKKHFSRKHGEKKWKCEKCSKKYAVQSDWKAHSKTCGTREYKCDCGTLFSRKDSFITHRAFCDALAEESARLTSVAATNLNFRNDTVNMSHGFANQGLQADVAGVSQFGSGFRSDLATPGLSEMVQMASGNLFGSSSMSNFGSQNQLQGLDKSNIATSSKNSNLSLSAIPHGLKEERSSLYSDSQNKQSKPVAPMSATALLQKAAQMGSTRSNPPLFGNSFNIITSSSSNTSNFNSLNQNRSELQQVFQNVKQPDNNFSGTVSLAMSDGVMGSSSSNLKLHQGSNPMENSLTRDFLGMGSDQSGRPFFSQELAKFASMGSPMGLSQFTSNH
ncbi:zinc finger protein JACKDAW [Pistacia vera]|uniref:zinc finger protein JACKDAW n=1 Tax=Pistacia vera TaxID=55513 RepID=UPI001263CBE6|nr:zinc finger protein JACKDAW [Pistacia vera]